MIFKDLKRIALTSMRSPTTCIVIVALLAVACYALIGQDHGAGEEKLLRQEKQFEKEIAKLSCHDPIDSLLKRKWKTLKDEPILLPRQVKWILDTVRQTSASSSTTSASKNDNNNNNKFLVFGVGYDSSIWHDLNTCGQTIFLEDNEKWKTTVQQQHPNFNIHSIQYQQREGLSVATADELFWKDPYVIKIPSLGNENDNDCFSVVLVDAPNGSEPYNPGRMESGFWTLSMAQRCTSSSKNTVHVFVHDAERTVESRLIQEMIRAGGVEGTDAGSPMNGRESTADNPKNVLRKITFHPPSTQQ